MKQGEMLRFASLYVVEVHRPTITIMRGRTIVMNFHLKELKEDGITLEELLEMLAESGRMKLGPNERVCNKDGKPLKLGHVFDIFNGHETVFLQTIKAGIDELEFA